MQKIPDGNRKLLSMIASLVSFTIISVTVIIVRPEGINLMDFFFDLSLTITAIHGIFIGGNSIEHLANRRKNNV
jgi:hypothetical protein